MRILHLEADRYPQEALQRLHEVGQVDVISCRSQADLLAQLSGGSYQAIFTRLGLAIDRAVMDLQPDLRYVVTPTTGLNHLDEGEARRRGIEVLSLRGETEFLTSVRSTAEHTWALLLASIRRVPEAHGLVLGGEWSRSSLIAGELDGKTLGILGFGRLGRMLVRYGVAFGMKVLAADRRPDVDRHDAGATIVSVDELLASSDCLCVMISYDSENRRFLNHALIRRMKPGVVLVNTSRGEVVDERALLAALEDGHVGAAALDVLDGDSSWDGDVPAGHALVEYARTHSNLILTPHVGGYARDSVERTRRFVTEKFIRLLASQRGEAPTTILQADR